MTVEVAYADATLQLLLEVEVPIGATVQQAIEASRIIAALPTGFVVDKVGIFGRVVAPASRVEPGDRVEIYRPLTLDPKEARRRRAAARK